MNSKECLNAVLDMLNYEQVDECDKKGLLRTIKQDLDRLEQLEKEKEELLLAHSKVLKDFSDTNQYTLDIIRENTKLKKALDILKKKIVNLETLNISADFDTYREILKDNPTFYGKLTQEEFELLKEMLEEE